MAQGIKADIPVEQVEKLARLGANNREIGDFFYVTEACIRRRFSKVLIKCRAERRVKLKQLMWERALNGNVPILIWLSKNELGMSDKVESTTTEKQTVTVTLE